MTNHTCLNIAVVSQGGRKGPYSGRAQLSLEETVCRVSSGSLGAWGWADMKTHDYSRLRQGWGQGELGGSGS